VAELSVFVLIFVALVIGFYLGGYVKQRKHTPLLSSLPWSSKRYYKGLTYLLNEETDEAIDGFIADVDVNADTLEIHLALGNFLRRRGEIARAVKIHQSLLARPSLSPRDMQEVQLDLARDYIHSGLLDRAESLLKELVDNNGVTKELRVKSLRALLEVYQDTGEWLKAIDIADRLTTRKFVSQTDVWREAQAHFSCELAESAMSKKNWLDTRRWVRTALRYDKNSVRGSLLQATLDMQDERYPAAIASLKRIPRQNPELASEMIEPLYACYAKLDSTHQLRDELLEYLREHRDLRALNYLSGIILKYESKTAYLDMLSAELARYPELEAAVSLVSLLRDRHVEEPALYGLLKPVIDMIIQPKHHYDCVRCGFEGEHMHWLCPSCKSWASMRYV